MLIVYFLIHCVIAFDPDTTDYDAYGLKVASNDQLIVEAVISQSNFFIRLAPYNSSLTCTVAYPVSSSSLSSSNYVYSVAVGKNQASISFTFIGENFDTVNGTTSLFIGMLTYTGVSPTNYLATKSKKQIFPCTGWKDNYYIHYFPEFEHEEFYIVGIDPQGVVAYGLGNEIIIIYNTQTDQYQTLWGNVTWSDTTFMPRAVDVSLNGYLVVSGYVDNGDDTFSACAYLIDLSNFTIVDRWFYTPINNTWQSTLTNWDAGGTYSSKYDISVSINDENNQVLIGIPSVNTVILLFISTSPLQFVYGAMHSNGKTLGYGKAVQWLGTDIVAILVNTYSLNNIWSSSQIYLYELGNNTTTNFLTTLQSILPNIQQTIAATIGPMLLTLVSTQNGKLIVLDSSGNIYIILPSQPGFYSDISTGYISTQTPCIGGTYKSQTGIGPCHLCSSGTKTSLQTGSITCVACSVDSFCPLGSVQDVSYSALETTSQAIPYPMSPNSVRFDNILMSNMFIIDSSRQCIVISPIFWALITILIGINILIVMIVLKYFVSTPRGKNIRNRIKTFFRQTDLVGEGEMWVGGIASFAIIVLVSFAYAFSNSFYTQYPIELVNGSPFACDPELRNAQFDSGLMPLGIAPNEDEEQMFVLLNEQQFTIHIDFINTLFRCDDVSILQVKDTSIPLDMLDCQVQNDNATLSLSALLPSQGINIQFILTGTNTIGGFRVGLLGSAAFESNETKRATYTLLALEFYQSFYVENHLLAQNPAITIQLTKVINRTEALSTDRDLT
ncbi:unnamed protein product, partial [Didymodactylos carnosus]